jgi:hypothetical protein
MNPSTESQTAGEPTDDSQGRAFPGRVRGQRLEITTADLTMYSMITGRAPSKEERKRALTWSESDPLNGQLAGALGRSASSAIIPAHALRPWHPAAISLRIRDIWLNGLTLRVSRPQVSHWVRRVSLALQQGRQRVKQQGR